MTTRPISRPLSRQNFYDPSGRRFGSGGEVSPYLDGILADAVMDLDATIEDSYDGSSKTWANLISSTGTDYDFWRGADGTVSAQDPAFVGTAGSAAAYFAPDGGDRCAPKNTPTALNRLQRTDGTGSIWTLTIAVRTPSSHSGTKALFGGSWGSDNGLYMYVGGVSGQLRLWQASGSSSSSLTLGNLAVDTDYLITVVADMTQSTGNITHYINTTSGTTLNLSPKATSTDEADGVFLMATSDAGTPRGALSSGWRYRAISLAEGSATPAQVAQIFSMYETRHSIDYTP